MACLAVRDCLFAVVVLVETENLSTNYKCSIEDKAQWETCRGKARSLVKAHLVPGSRKSA